MLMIIQNSPLQKAQYPTPSPLTLGTKPVSQHNICCSYCALSIYYFSSWDPQSMHIPHRFSSKRRIWDRDLIPVRCVAIHFPFMNALGKHCGPYFFLLFSYFDLGRTKWAPGNGLTRPTAQNSSYRSVKTSLFFRTSKQFHAQGNLENLLGLGSTTPKQAAEKTCQA